MKTCPDNLVVNIDSANNTALVKWDIPEGNDNSRQQPKITEANGYRPNTRFAAGSYLLRYRIEDADGNVGQSCVFKLRVQSNTIDYFITWVIPPTLEEVAGACLFVRLSICLSVCYAYEYYIYIVNPRYNDSICFQRRCHLREFAVIKNT